MESTRRLAAIMFTDIAWFTKLSAEDEEKGVELIETQRELLKPIVVEFDGDWLKEIGDGLLLVFPSSKQAVNCGIKIQQTVKNIKNLNLRIGIHQGDVLEKDGDVFGDDVNISSRIEPFAAVGGVAISHKVRGDISGSPEFAIKYIGQPKLKGVKQKVEVYCIISHGLPETKLSDVSAKLEKHPSYWLKYGVPIILALTVGLFVFTGRNGVIESIAVLPLDNLSNDADQDYFADGMTVALIGELSNYGALRVISRQSVMQYKESQLPLPEIARELGADAIVEGSVYREGNTVRISIGLIHAGTDENIWQQDFDRELASILSLHRDLALTIAEQIEVALTPDEETHLNDVGLVDVKAYEAYLRGRSHWYRFTKQDMEIATNYYEFAFEMDPNYARAYVGYAEAMATPAHLGFVPSSDVYPTARKAILHALELDDNLAEAHDMLARLHFVYDWAPGAAEREFKRAIELNSSYPEVRVVYSQMLSALGRSEEAIEQARVAIELDPRNNWFQAELAARFQESGHVMKAIHLLQFALEEEPDLIPGHSYLWGALFRNGEYENALTHARVLFSLYGDVEIVAALEKTEDAESYQSVMRRAGDVLSRRSEVSYVSPYIIAKLYAHASETETALDWLEKAIAMRDTQIVYAKSSTSFYQLRHEERFKVILHQISLK